MMRELFIVAFMFGACVAVGGCEQTSTAATDPRVEAVSTQLAELSAELAKAQRQQALLLERVGNAERTLRSYAPKSRVEFDPSESSYLRVDGDLGSFAVAISDVRPFADGVRVTLKLGNLSSATYSGATLRMEYGPRAPSGKGTDPVDAAATWLEALQEREEKVSAKLGPGRWNPIQVTLPKIDPKEFGYLAISIETNEIALY